MIKIRKAFSMIEVIFVLIILGIVASISSQIIVQVYENYILQKALYNTTTKTELAINQIVNRLSYVIDGTTISKDTNSSDWVRLKDIPTGENNFTTIEWIGYDNDSFSASVAPYWSGVANYETATVDSFITPASDLSKVAIIMNKLSNGEVNLTDDNPAGLIFIEKAKQYVDGKEYTPACMGLVDTNTSCIFPVKIGSSDTNLTFVDTNDTNATDPKIITERYKLAWSAYALVPEENSNGLHDLYLYYNYQPWNKENYEDNGTKKLLIKDISVFKFTENGGVIQLKLCASENIGQDYNISSCKEKAIIR